MNTKSKSRCLLASHKSIGRRSLPPTSLPFLYGRTEVFVGTWQLVIRRKEERLIVLANSQCNILFAIHHNTSLEKKALLSLQSRLCEILFTRLAVKLLLDSKSKRDISLSFSVSRSRSIPSVLRSNGVNPKFR